MIFNVLTVALLLSSCAKDNSNNPVYLSANISGMNWSANSISAGSDTCTGYTAIEADNSDGSLFYLNFPTDASGNYGVSSGGDCSIQYIDPQGDLYDIQGGSIAINSPLFSGTNGSFDGVGINDANSQDQINISGGSFHVNS